MLLVLSPEQQPLQSPPGLLSTLPVAWRDPALALICCRGRQTRQPPPGAGGGATRPVRAAETRAGAGARGDQGSLQPPPARDRAGEWCRELRMRPGASFSLPPGANQVRCSPRLFGRCSRQEETFLGEVLLLSGWLALSAWGDQLQPPRIGVHFHQHLLTKAFFLFFLVFFGESHF